MISFLKNIFHKKDSVSKLATESQSVFAMSEHENKSKQDMLREQWKALTPHRKDTCTETTIKIKELSEGSMDFDERISKTVNLIYSNLDLYFVFLWVVEDNWRFFYTGAGENIDLMKRANVNKKIELNLGLVGHVITNRKYTVAWDMDPEEEFPYFDAAIFPRVRSEIALPLFLDGNIIGVLDLGSRIRLDFREEDRESLTELATQVAKVFSTRV